MYAGAIFCEADSASSSFGFRFDAIPYLVEEGDQLKHTRGTHEVLHVLGDAIRREAPASFTVGEMGDGSVDILASYYPDQLDYTSPSTLRPQPSRRHAPAMRFRSFGRFWRRTRSFPPAGGLRFSPTTTSLAR